MIMRNTLVATSLAKPLQLGRKMPPDPLSVDGKGAAHTRRRIDHTNAERLVISEARASKIGAR